MSVYYLIQLILSDKEIFNIDNWWKANCDVMLTFHFNIGIIVPRVDCCTCGDGSLSCKW